MAVLPNVVDPLQFIQINGQNILKPENFSPEREDIYAAEITTCTGDTIADLIGWKYADITLSWPILPQSMIDILIAMYGESTITFDDVDGTSHTEKIVRNGIVSMRNRNTIQGETWWKNVSVSLRFLEAHSNE